MKNFADRSLSLTRSILAIGVVLVAWAFPVCAQQTASNPSSDLAAQNMNRVAATATQIQEVLRKDSGLLVELKRWVAKEATDRGQLIDDQDMTDQAIFARLVQDLEFRAVATRLLQRYGYLMPKVNPDSEAGIERQELLKERGRLRAAAEAADQKTRADRAMQTDYEEGSSGRPATSARESDKKDQRRRAPNASPRSNEQPQQSTESTPPDIQRALTDRTVTTGTTEGTGELRKTQLQTGNQVDLALPRLDDSMGLSGAVDARSQGGRAPLPSENQTAGSGVASPSFESRMRVSSGRSPAERIERGEGEVERDSSALIHKSNPFADIPSLYDMYQQFPVREEPLKRFGEKVFKESFLEPDVLPMDLPVGPDYVVGPGDGLTFDLWGSYSQRLQRTVDQEGRVTLPEVGPILVSGRSLADVQRNVQQILRTQFRDVSADVSLSRLRTIRVYVVGDVAQPGAYDISSLSTPLNALFVAGGPTDRGSLRTLRHFRGKQLVQEVDVYDLLLRGVRSDLRRLENGDTVLVPPIGAQVTVEGMVRRPAVYELNAEKSITEVLELAGGILPTATLRKVQVQRVEAHQKRTMMSLDLPDSASPASTPPQLDSFNVQAGDEIRVFPISPYNPDAVYLQGHVLRPGRYTYREGLKVSDLVPSYADLLPEPAAKYAEIIRINPPDNHPSVEGFDLRAAIEKPETAPKLMPLDTVRIFSRYDFENPPIVSVLGEVRAPGVYRTSGVAHLRDAVQLAGGVTPDALTDNAQVFRYGPDSKLKIFSVNLAEALAGNPLDNVLLQPRDRVVIHKNLAKADPPSVYIKGEVAKPGRYPLTTNLRASDLIRLAGGLKRSAYTETADLTRFLGEDANQQSTERQEIKIAAALAGDAANDPALRHGDTLTIRQVPGWNDIGASITIAGDVQHSGIYGIQPGERLSSVLKRAGGFLPTGYPQGAVLERLQVRELEEKNHQELIRRIQVEQDNLKLKPVADPDQKEAQEAALRQLQVTLENLISNPPVGRLVIRISRDIRRWENSPADIEVRAGDTLIVPKQPNFVMVRGQVYNPTAITFRPGKSAEWYLHQAGGPTQLANKKSIFVIRADGSVLGSNDSSFMWSGSSLGAVLMPGDSIVVPEKAVGGSQVWKNLLQIAQFASSMAVTFKVVLQ
jgi:polysaccharide biosynthesis/export protein